MTIQGAMQELIALLDMDDIPIYYKGGIKKAIETIDDYIDGKDDYVKRIEERVMTNGDAIYYIKQLAVLSTEKEMPKIEEALKTAIKALSEDYAKGFQSGYKAKEYDRQGDCDGCKFIGLRYIEGAKPRCEGCCRNYADGYVAEQTEPQTEREGER